MQQPQGACQPALIRAAHAGAFRRLIKVLQHVDGSTGQMAWHVMCEMSQVEEARQAIAEQYGVQQLVQVCAACCCKAATIADMTSAAAATELCCSHCIIVIEVLRVASRAAVRLCETWHDD